MKKYLLLCLITLLFFSNGFAQTNTKIKTINKEIANVKASIQFAKTKRKNLSQSLKKTELQTSTLTKKVQKLNRNIKNQQKILQKLKQSEISQKKQLEQQKNLLKEQAQTAYLFSRQPYLKLLLNQKDPSTISRTLNYYRYITRAQLTIIENIKQTLDAVQNNQAQISQELMTLAELNNQQQQQRRHLQSTQAQRQNLIKKLNNHIQTRRQKLSQLLDDKRRLAQAIQQLENQPTAYSPTKNFAKLRGRLSWPTKGKISERFGTQVAQSELRWEGVLIKAPDDQPVFAVADGKVIFARWLSGYGLLLIINHGNGYMTLYGRNSNLYKKVNDIVHRGDLIATVGETGGYTKPALYFAIRHNGKPINPTRWCSKKSV